MNETDIANLSLGRLAVGQRIASLGDQTNLAKQCNQFYHFARQEVLRDFPWDLALRPVALSLVAGQVFPGWTFVYAYPANTLMVRAISDRTGLRFMRTSVLCRDQDLWPTPIKVPFKVALKDDGASKVIVTDLQNAYAFTTVDVTNTGVFAVDLASAIAWRLAMEVGGPLQAKAELIDRAQQQYLFWRSQAAANAMNESQPDPRPESPSIACRS